MAALTTEQKKFLVVRAAMFDSGEAMIEAFQEEYGIKIEKQQVFRYRLRPNCKGQLGKDLEALFHAARAQYLADIAAIPIANRAHRLTKLNDMFEAAFKDPKKQGFAAAIIEMAAKEVGDVFTNTSKVQGKVDHEHTGTLDFSAGENRALLADAFKKALELPPPALTKH